ncbi:condensin-2 complex subunit D3 [Tanacetum coccineum]
MVYFAPSATLLRIVHRVDRLVKQRGDEGQGQGRAMMRWKQVKSLHVLDYILFWVWFISTCFLIVWLKAIVHTVSEILVMALESCGNLSNYNKSCSLCSEILSELCLSSSIIMSKSQARIFGPAFVVHKMAMDSDEIRKCLLNFSKYLVCKAPERAELRALAVESILEIVKALEHKDQIDFVDYVVNMTRGKPQLRLLGVDLIHSLIMSLDDPLGASLENGYESSWGFNCLQALVERCSDATEHGLLLIWHN